MLINPFVFGAAAPVGGGSGWNPADALASKFTFTNSDRNATGASAPDGSVRGLVSKTAGVRYFEIGFTSAGSPGVANSQYWIGVGSGTMPLSGRPGFDFTGGNFGALRANGQATNNAGFAASFGSLFITGGLNTLMCVFDFSTGIASVGINGTFQGSITVAAGFTSMFPFFTLEGAIGAPVGGAQLATKAGEFAYAVPSGASPWEA